MIVQSKPVAQVYRLFGALVALLLVMAVGFTIARWRSSQPAGSPYGGLAAVAPSTTVPTISAPARVAAAVPPATPAPASVAPQPTASVAPPAPVAMTPPAGATAVALADPTRNAPRVIALDKSNAGAAPLPAPAAAVAAATASQAATVTPVPAPVATATVPAIDPAAPAPAMASATPATDVAPGGLININTASAEALNHLPGGGHIGKTIVRHRPYASVQDLVDHRVLRAGDFARIRAHITAN